MDVTIETARNNPEELVLKQTLEGLLRRYALPIYTEKICIDSATRSHSHPVLTISTKRTDWRCNLKTLVHEQMHWLHNTDGTSKKWENALAYFKEKYPVSPLEFANNSPKSFWVHIIVCWNTENWLRKLLNADDRKFVDETCPDYTETTKLIRDNFDIIGSELATFGLVSE